MRCDDNQLVDLLSRCAIRDQQALKHLYGEVSGYLNQVAYRMLRCQDASNEVLQEAFIQIWQNAGTYRAYESRPLTWMTSIVRYRVLDRLKADKRRQQIMPDEVCAETAAESFASGSSPEQEAENLAVFKELAHCMALLSLDIRRSIELAYFYGYSREEIAASLNTKINTVKSWLKRGSERLKACLLESSSPKKSGGEA